jgi:hypothetical protein
MFPARYFAPRYFAPRYFAEVGANPTPPVPPSGSNYHSWFVKAIGIKTKVNVNSQVDSETGDTP